MENTSNANKWSDWLFMQKEINKPLVYVVILTWNHLDDLIVTIKSLLEQNYLNIKITISDNGSSDGTQNYIKKNLFLGPLT